MKYYIWVNDESECKDLNEPRSWLCKYDGYNHWYWHQTDHEWKDFRPEPISIIRTVDCKISEEEAFTLMMEQGG